MSFDPEVGDKIVLNATAYTVEARMAGLKRPFQMQGGKAIVYKLKRTSDGRLWAFKVFQYGFRGEHQLASVKRLQKVTGIAGLTAANQIVIPASDPSTAQYPEFAWSVLMPWIEGRTWAECLNDVAESGKPITKDQALAETLALAKLFESLEARGITHCDLSCGNVIRLPGNTPEYELIDLEDMRIGGEAMPNMSTSGTAGYGLPGVHTTAVIAGDRYAAAIILLESLTLATPDAPQLAYMEGVFNGNRENLKDQQRFKNIIFHINQWKPHLATLFTKAWNAESLEACPKISEYVAALQGIPAAAGMPVSVKPVAPGASPFNQPPPPIGTKKAAASAPPPPPPKHGGTMGGSSTPPPIIHSVTVVGNPGTKTQTGGTANATGAPSGAKNVHPVTPTTQSSSSTANRKTTSTDSSLSALGWFAVILLAIGWYMPQTRAWAWTIGGLGLVGEYIKTANR